MYRILIGDCRAHLATIVDNAIDCVVTSPPYFGLRDYGHPGQIGLEPSPAEYIDTLLQIFREVRRVLKPTGTFWLNIGDSYAGSGRGGNPNAGTKQGTNKGSRTVGVLYGRNHDSAASERERIKSQFAAMKTDGIKAKDLIGIPWRLALALQADGWYLRQDIIWHKPNPMPESILDRCTRSHEYLFMLTKSAKYFYDAEAIKEPSVYAPGATPEVEREKGYYSDKWSSGADKQSGHGRRHAGFNKRWKEQRNDGSFKAIRETRNKRSVWTIPPKPYNGAHFAVFPPALVEPCVLAGSPRGGLVLDPFMGSGTTGLVATQHGRGFIGIELNSEYAELARQRLNPTL